MDKKNIHKSALNEKEGVSRPDTVNPRLAGRIRKTKRKTPSVDELFTGIRKNNQAVLSRAITLIESHAARHQDQARELLEKCLPFANKSIRLGITGVPGVGKSTFIENFGRLLIRRGKKVAVLAVDPSSSISRGSILGDKTRMEELVKERDAFIRPSPSGETLGGVARKTRETIILCEAAGFDVILIETVGVGQSETAVHSMSDFFLLLKLAGAGDELQGMKRGIMEMADCIVINKADGDNLKPARMARNEFNRALHLFPEKESGWTAKALLSSSVTGEGIPEIWETILRYFQRVKTNNYFEHKRKEQNKFWLMQTIEDNLKKRFFENPRVKKEMKNQLIALDQNQTTPFEAARLLLSLTQ